MPILAGGQSNGVTMGSDEVISTLQFTRIFGRN